MHGLSSYIFVFCLWYLLGSELLQGQGDDMLKGSDYKRVFVDTDKFDSTYLSVLEKKIPKVESNKLRYQLLNDLAYYWHTRNLNRAMRFTQEGLVLTRQALDTLWHARFQITQGAILLRMEKLDSAQMVLEAAKPRVLSTDLPLLNTQLGYVYERRGQLDKAADYALLTLGLGQQTQNIWAQAMAYSDLSNLFWKQSKFETGLKYGLQSLEWFESLGVNSLDYDFTLYVVGNNYLSLQKYDKALSYFKQCIAMGERYGFYNNLSDAYISLVELFVALGQHDQAEDAGSKALKYALLLDNDFMVMRSWLALGKAQNEQNKYVKAKSSLEECLQVATLAFGDNFYLSQAYRELARAYAGNLEYDKAYAAFHRYDVLKDKVFTAAADRRTSVIRTEFDLADKEGTIVYQESQIRKHRTRQVLFSLLAALLFLFLMLAYIAIRNNRKKNKLLNKQNLEKEFLLKEIHHRVKNNLEVVSSLLALQAASIQDKTLQHIMEDSQLRVQSMGMIHQKLYKGNNLTTIEMKGYFQTLSEYIQNAFGRSEEVTTIIDMNEVEVDIDRAVSIGLIVNELMTNALKHAFPPGLGGLVKVSLLEGSDSYFLKVSDNGVGFSANIKPESGGFGTKLIRLLTDQLEGKMEQKHHNGTSISFQFPKNIAA